MSTTPASIGRYKVVRAIGQGGMGSLYLAWDPSLGRHTALKLLTDDDPELRERFAREARAAASMRHRHIVAIFDVGEHEGRPFIAMEYIQGHTLGDLIRRDPALSVVRNLEILEQICDGLGYAHRTGIVHRDIKPANVMVDRDGSVKILDFGVARVSTTARMTRAGVLLGTLNYLSPEQVSGKPVDHRSDIFAVGLVAYEMFARRRAFGGSVLGGVLNQILHEPPESLAIVRRGLHPNVIHVVERAIEKDPNRRYQDLGAMRTEVLRALQMLSSGEAPTATVPRSSGVPPAPSMAQTPPPATNTPTPTTRPRSATEREELARLRAGRIEAHLRAASEAFARRDYAAAAASCEEALVIDPDEVRAMELLDRVRDAQTSGLP